MEGQVDNTSATSGNAFPFLYRLMVESSSPLPNRRARRSSGVSRMVYTCFTNMWLSRLRMWSTPMRTRTVRRVAVPHQV
mgnify:CR=1 FL=1